VSNFYKKALLFFLYSIPADEKVNIIKDFARSHGNSYVHVRTSRLSDDEKIPDDGHPNKNGHRTLADELFLYITENNIIPCD